MPDDLAFLKEQFAYVHESAAWQEFRRVRAQDWEPLIRRQAPQTNLIPSLAHINVDIQSADLLKAVSDFVAILVRNDTKIDAYSLDQGTHAKRDVEDIRISSAISWAKQNDGRRLSRSVFESVIKYGVGVVYKMWHMPPEPELEEGLSEEEALKARAEYFGDQKDHCFDWRYVSPLEVTWFPLEKPEVFFQESIIPYVEAKKLQDKKGNALRLDALNKIHFMGESEPLPEVTDRTAQDEKPKIHFIRRAALDKKTKRWRVTEYVRMANEGLDEARELDSYDCPFGRPPYFVIPGGDVKVTETEPHLRYWPGLLHPLIVDVQEQNALLTAMVQMALNKAEFPFFVPLRAMTPSEAETLKGLELNVVEGAGAEGGLVFRRPRTGSKDVPLYPDLKEMPPEKLDEAFVLRLQQLDERIAEHKPNRFLIGQVGPGEMKQAPATSILNQGEAAALPFNLYMDSFNNFAEDFLNAELEAIAYWDEGVEGEAQKPYVFRTTGDEPLKREPVEAGKVVTLTAAKLKTPYILVASTKTTTQAEEAMEEQQADIAYEKNADTKEQWLRRRGSDDPQKQIEALLADTIDREVLAQMMPVYQQAIRTLIQMTLGVKLMPPVLPPGQGETGLPGQNGGTPMLARPQMTPPPMTGVQATSTLPGTMA